MTVIKQIEIYLLEMFGIYTKAKPWKGKHDLPFFLSELYVFYEVNLLERPCIVMVARGNDEITAATLVKHFKQLQAKWAGLCIYVRATISAYTRKRLIEHRIPFAIPDNQMYLPDIGIDLKEHFRKERASIHILKPATQTVLIYALVHKKARLNPSELARELHYTKMTMTRAFDELESLGIGEFFQQGRERWLCFREDRNTLWNRVRPFMYNPVKKRIWLQQNSKNKAMIEQWGVISGLTALAKSSMLNQPTHPVYAMDMKIWKKAGIIQEIPSAEEADVELELWSYDPKLFEKDDLVDPFSLYLSLQDNKDERLESALEKLMEQIDSNEIILCLDGLCQ